MFPTPLAQTSWADEDVDAFVSYLGRVIHTDEDQTNIRVKRLKRRDSAQHDRPRQSGPHTDLELSMQGCINPKFADDVVELFQHPGAVAIEARPFGRQLQDARGSCKERHSKIILQSLDRPADRCR